MWTVDQSNAIYSSGSNLLVAAAAGSGKTAVLVERIIKKVTNETNPVDIDKLLVVTFTNAAAAEMRERIGEALSKEIEKCPDSKILQRQLTLINKANIITIHSFCLKVIKSNYHLIDLDPNFRIGDGTECTLLKNEILEELFEEKYIQRDEDFLKLIDCYGERNDIKVQNMVLDLYNFSKSSPWYDEWLIKSAEDFNISEDFDFSKTKWAKILTDNVRVELLGLRDKMNTAIKIINQYENSIGHYLITFNEDLVNINYLLENVEDFRKLNLGFCDLKFSTLSRKKVTEEGKEAQEQVKAIRDEVKKKIGTIKEDIFSDTDSVNITIKKLYPIMKALVNLVIDFDTFYSSKKRDKGIIDFNDIEHFCLNILVKKDEENNILRGKVAEEYINFFEEILIDEYQDSNLVQETILRAISRNGTKLNSNIFMVGDIKQSIYRFRQAKPELFLEKYRNYSDYEHSENIKNEENENTKNEENENIKNEENENTKNKDNENIKTNNSKDIKIKLFKNFRSRKEVLDGVNFIFKQVMSSNIGELEYDRGEYLNLGADFEPINKDKLLNVSNDNNSDTDKDKDEYKDKDNYSSVNNFKPICGGKIEVHIMDKNMNDSADILENTKEQNNAGDFQNGDYENNKEQDEEEEELDGIQLESRMVSEIINKLIKGDNGEQFKVWDKNTKEYRNVKYKDIVILMRSVQKSSPIFIEELGHMNVPVFADTGTGYFETTEIKTILSLLQIVDNPLQDVPLLAVLRSPIVGFSALELIDIRLVNKKIPLFEILKDISYNHVNYVYFSENPMFNSDSINKNTALVKKIVEFINIIEGYREKSFYLTTDEFIWYLYTETGFYGYVGAMPGGIQRQANLRILFDRAKQFEETSYKGLFNFINFIGKLKNSSSDMGSAKILGENDDVVRIMSIHKSKGLEFPIVILACTGKKFNFMDMNKSILYHQDLGIGPDFVDVDRRISYPTILKGVIKQKIKIETLSEEMRILYVAMTRAKEKLIITGMVKGLDKTIQKWCNASDGLIDFNEKLPEYYILGSQNYLDLIGPSIFRHKDLKEYRENIYGKLPLIDENEESTWSFKIWEKERFISNVSDDELDEIDIIKELESAEYSEDSIEIMKIVDEKMNWKYEYINSTTIPTKFTVSELKRKFNLDLNNEENDAHVNMFESKNFNTLKKPRFLEKEKTFSASEKGTLMHLAMQHVDMLKTSSVDEIKKEIERLVQDEFITEEQSKVINIKKIFNFWNSSLGMRIKKSNTFKKEVPFFIEISVIDIYKELPKEKYENEKVILQGVIDGYFEESDGIILVDYKTDYVESVEAIKEKYSIQLKYYEEALKLMTGKVVKAKYLYLFSTEDIVLVN